LTWGAAETVVVLESADSETERERKWWRRRRWWCRPEVL